MLIKSTNKSVLVPFFSMILHIPEQDLCRLYAEFNDEGLVYAAMFTVYKRMLGTRVCYSRDIKDLLPDSEGERYRQFIDWSVHKGYLHVNKTFIYSPLQNTFLGYSGKIWEAEYSRLCSSVPKKPKFFHFDKDEFMQKLISLSDEYLDIECPVSEDVLAGIAADKVRTENLVKFSEFYLMKSTYNIGFLSDLKIGARAFKYKNEHTPVSVLRKAELVMVDKHNGIFYDPMLREQNCLPAKPTPDEIIEARRLYDSRAPFMNDLQQYYSDEFIKDSNNEKISHRCSDK